MDTHTTDRSARRPAFSGWVKKVAVLAALALLAGLAGRFLLFDRLDTEIRRRLLTHLGQKLPHLRPELASAKRIEGQGIRLRGLQLYSRATPGKPLLEADELLITCRTDLQDFMSGDLDVKHIVAKRVHGRLTRGRDGSWELGDWKLPSTTGSRAIPPIDLIDSKLEIIDESHSGEPLVFDNLQVKFDSPQRKWDDGPVSLPAPSPGTAKRVRWHRLRCKLHSRVSAASELVGWYHHDSGTWRAVGKINDLELNSTLWQMLPEQLQPQHFECRRLDGRVNLDVQVEHRPAATSQSPSLQYHVQGHLSKAHLAHARLPYPLTSLSADFTASNRGFSISGARGWHGTTAVFGEIQRAGFQADAHQRITLRLRDLQMQPSLIQIWPEVIGPVWEKYDPSGLVDLDYNFDSQRPAQINDDAEGPFQSELILRCRNTSFAFQTFPYRLNHGKGLVHYRDGHLTTHDLTAEAAEQIVRLDADFRGSDDNALGHLEVSTSGPLPIDQKFIRALPAELRTSLSALRPGGWITLDKYRIESFEPGVPRHYARIDLNDCNMRFVKFPYPISRLNGPLVYTDGTWSFDNITGYHGATHVKFAGRWNHQQEPFPQLEITASDVLLEDDLRTAVEQVSPAASELWETLRFNGTFDHVRINLDHRDRRPTLTFDLQKWKSDRAVTGGREISIHPRRFPYRLDNVTGTFHYEDGLLSLKNVRAQHGQSTIRVGGQCRFDQFGWRMDLTELAVDELQFDHQLLAALSNNVRSTCEQLRPTGSIVMQGSVSLWRRSRNPSLEADWDIHFAMADASMSCGPRLQHINGGLHLNGQLRPTGYQCRGYLDLDSAFIGEEQLTRIQGPLWMDNQKLLIGGWAERSRGAAARGLTAGAFGGRATLHAQVTFRPEPQFVLHAELDNADLTEIARDYTRQGRRLSGRAAGTLQLSGRMAETHTWRGNGDLHLYDADIYQLPAMVSLLKLLSIRPPDTTAFTTSDAVYKIHGDRVIFDRIDFNGDAISLRGTGWMGFDKQLDLNFYTLVGRNKLWVPIVSKVVAEASRNLFQLKVQGTVGQPDIYRMPLPELDETIQRLFPELSRRDERPRGPILRPAAIMRDTIFQR